MNDSVCIVIPIYNVCPTENEVLSITRNLSMLKEYDVYFAYPRGMSVDKYKDIIKSDVLGREGSSENSSIKTVFVDYDSSYFQSNKTYSRLLLSEHFYTPFLGYKYMLIAQTDTLILGGHKLGDFVDKSYDYWGAPWPDGPFTRPYTMKDRVKLLFIHHPARIHVGNGGFSLRKIRSTVELIKKKKNYIKFLWRFNEDMFFSYYAYLEYNGYRACTAEEAASFALEVNMKEEIEKGHIPYAVHAFEKYYSLSEIKEAFQ